MLKIRSLFAALVVLIAAGILPQGTAHAQTSRLYLAGYLGLNTFGDVKFTESATPGSGDFELDNATSFAGALGIRLNRSMRMEGELFYSNADFKNVDLAGVGSFATAGELSSTIAFLNLYYDFDVPWKVQPFVGAGIGYGWHNGTITDGATALPNASADASGLAWNVGGGIKYRPRADFAFTGGYRYIDTVNLDIGTYELDYASHEFRLGLEWDLPVR